MALEIRSQREGEDMAKWTADRRLWLDADKTKVIEVDTDGNPGEGAAFLLCGKGREVPGDVVKKYKLNDKAKRKARKPTSDKAVKPAANK